MVKERQYIDGKTIIDEVELFVKNMKRGNIKIEEKEKCLNCGHYRYFHYSHPIGCKLCNCKKYFTL